MVIAERKMRSLVPILLWVAIVVVINVHCLSSSFVASGGRSQRVRVQDYRKVLERNGLNWLVFERIDVQQGITHTEFFRRRSAQKLSRIPMIGRFFKPLAKVGIRTRSVPGQGNLEDFIWAQFNDKEKDLGLKLGLLVYMWVAPKWRGRNLGEMLLSVAVEQCQNKGDKYMLCVHDDGGSGKLVEWYRRRCFYSLPDKVLEKGLIGSLTSPPIEETEVEEEGADNLKGIDEVPYSTDEEESYNTQR